MDRETAVSGFLQDLGVTPHLIEHKDVGTHWVFWSRSESNSLSADLGNTIHEKIISTLSNNKLPQWGMCQFWAPVTTIDGRRLLSTSGQPFSLCLPTNESAKYRLYSEKCQYNIDDVNEIDNGLHPMIMNGGPATAFLRRFPSTYDLQRIPVLAPWQILRFSFMLPICFPSQRDCIGVLELTFNFFSYGSAYYVLEMIKELKKNGLDVFYAQDLIPYKTIGGLSLAKDHIEEALKVVCESHNLLLAQVWIPHEDRSHVLLSSSLEDTPTNQLLAIKLTGYLSSLVITETDSFQSYYSLCDVILKGAVKDPALETLQDHESRYFYELPSNMPSYFICGFSLARGIVICLRSNDTGNYNYMFEFLWVDHLNYVKLLEGLLLTLKRCLPRFKFASGAELDEESDVIVVESRTYNETGETKKIKIFNGKKSSVMPKVLEEGNKPTVMDYIASSKVRCKTSPKVLTREDIEKQRGKTMKDAAKALNVSLSTLKRKLKKLGFPEWPGPSSVKRKANDSSAIQVDANEEDNGVVHEPSPINLNQDALTIKAEYAGDMIKFRLPVSQASFETVEKEIHERFNLSQGTYKLKYRDEDGDFILLTCDKDMGYCIESSRRSYPNKVQLQVLPSTQPTCATNLLINPIHPDITPPCIKKPTDEKFLKEPYTHNVITQLARRKNYWLYTSIDPSIGLDHNYWSCLIAMSNNGWLEGNHIDHWICMLLSSRTPDATWTILPSHFIVNMMISKSWYSEYADGTKPPYPSIKNVKRIYIPVNVPNKHWFLACLDVPSWTLTTYDSLPGFCTPEQIAEPLSVLDSMMPQWLMDHGSDLVPLYSFKRIIQEKVPVQASPSGDCGVWTCIFMERLIRGEDVYRDNEDVRSVAKEWRWSMAKALYERVTREYEEKRKS